ncbi:oligosaccharide flippase family protein [Bacillus sp. BSL6]|uniref:oligosaccharide flippase family protein n=1 Tax=Bacillus TaxID=1386 RepID=UPI003A804720
MSVLLKKKLFSKNITVRLMTSRIIQIILGGLAGILLARFMNPENYGLINLVTSIVTFFTIVFHSGISVSTAKHILNANSEKEKTQYIISGLFLQVVCYLCGVVILLISNEYFFEKLYKVNFDNKTLLLISLLTLSNGFILYYEHLLNSIKKQIVLTNILTFNALGRLILPIILVLNGFSFKGVLLGQVISGLISLLIPIGIFYRAIIDFNKIEQGVSDFFINIKNVLQYAFAFIFIEMSNFIFNNSDIMMISMFFSPKHVAWYSVTRLVIEASRAPAWAIGKMVSVSFTKIKDNSRQILFLSKLIKLICILFIPLTLWMFFGANNIILFLFGENYFESINVLKWYAIYYVVLVSVDLLNGIYDYIGYAKYRSIALPIIAIINVSLNYILIPQFGIEGAAFSKIIPYLALLIFYLYLIYTKMGLNVGGINFKLSLLWKGLILNLVLGGSLYMINSHLSIILSLSLSAIVFTSYYYVAYKTKLITKKELNLLLKN